MVILVLKLYLLVFVPLIADKPDIPEGPIVLEALLKNSVVISWKAPKDSGGSMITNYIVEKREDKEASTWELVSSSINGLSCRVPNLVDSAGYFFRVYAQNRYGNSEPLELAAPILIKSQLGELHIIYDYYILYIIFFYYI